MSEELILYIVSQLKAGFDRETIAEALKVAGHDQKLIETALIEGQKRINVVPTADTIPTAPTHQGASTDVPSGWSLMLGAFRLTFSRLDILGIVFIPAALLIALQTLVSKVDQGSIIFLCTNIVLSLIYAGNIAILMYVYSNNSQHPSYFDGLQWLVKRFFSYIWILLGVFFLKLGGFILLVIPGVILSVYALLSMAVLAVEDKRGFIAIMRSRDLVYGRFWKTWISFVWFFFVAALIVVLYILVFVLLSMVLEFESTPYLIISIVLTSVLQVVISTTAVGLIAHIYHVYSVIVPERTPDTKVKRTYVIIAWVGVFVIPLSIISSMMIVSLDDARNTSNDAAVMSTMSFSRSEVLLSLPGAIDASSYVGACAVIENNLRPFRARGTEILCNDGVEGYVIEAKLSTGDYYCADHTLFSDKREYSVGDALSCE